MICCLLSATVTKLHSFIIWLYHICFLTITDVEVHFLTYDTKEWCWKTKDFLCLLISTGLLVWPWVNPCDISE